VEFPPTIDHHIVAGLLKRFFREMANPLIPFEYYDRFINVKSKNSIETILFCNC
jgi:hypothetical protein